MEIKEAISLIESVLIASKYVDYDPLGLQILEAQKALVDFAKCHIVDNIVKLKDKK